MRFIIVNNDISDALSNRFYQVLGDISSRRNVSNPTQDRAPIIYFSGKFMVKILTMISYVKEKTLFNLLKNK